MKYYCKKFYCFINALFKERHILFELTRNDFRSRYLGSLLGIIWAFIHPSVTLAVMWFVFEVGFKTGPVNDSPFFIWLMCGMLPWNFFSEGALGGGNALADNSFLVKKVVFRVSFLPIIKVLSALMIHLIFIIILTTSVCATLGWPSLHLVQFIYYSLQLILLTTGLAWLISAIVPFFKDFGQLIAIIIQIGFWATPIFWQIDIIPENLRYIIQLNPLFYIIEGYRDAFLGTGWFWSKPILTLYTWVFTITTFVVGGLTFARLRPHYADVL